MARFAVLALAVFGAVSPGGRAAQEASKPAIAARGKGLAVTSAELERVLLERYGMNEQGRELLELLVRTKLLELLAREAKIEVTDEGIARRWSELDRAARASGQSRGLSSELEERGVSVADFRETLRLQIVLERLARAALGRAEGASVSGDEQEVWLGQEISERGLERPAPPWLDGVVARSGTLEVGAAEFGAFLRKRLPREEVSETAWHLLLLKGIEKRMPDLAPEARERAVEAEMQRRRKRHEAEFPAITFEQRVGASGRTVELLRMDPSIQIAALTHLWVDRTTGAEGLRETYEAERSYFEGYFGRAVRTHMLFLVAGRFVNELQKRTFEDADLELERIAGRIGNLDDFVALSSELSEEPTVRSSRGDLGWVTRNNPRVPAPIRKAVFEDLERRAALPAGGRLLGPVRLDAGSVLLWISENRESPSWEGMSEIVHEELRRRFVEDVMPQAAVELVPEAANEAGAPAGGGTDR